MSTEARIPPAPACPNCGAGITGRYCPQCGQKQGSGVPGVLDYLHELADHYVAIDGKLWRTLWLLLARPGVLVTEYIAGRRQRYIGPLKLYLSFSLVFFVLASLLPSAGVHVTTQLDPGSEERERVGKALEEVPQPLREPLERTLAEAKRDPAAPAERVRDIGEGLLFAFRRVFGGRWWALALRAAVASAAYALLLLATIAAGVGMLALRID